MVPAPFCVVLDVNVLFPFTVRGTLLRAAALGMYQVHGSAEILAEAVRNLISTGRMNDDQTAHLIPAMPNDEKDRHVAAVAVKGGAEVVVTRNLKDF